MKYRATCLWLCLIWKEVLFLALVEKQATNIKCKFVSVSIYKSMYEALHTDVCELTSGPGIAKLFRREWFEWADSGWFQAWRRTESLKVVMENQCWNRSMLWSLLAIFVLSLLLARLIEPQLWETNMISYTLKSFKQKIMLNDRSDWNYNTFFWPCLFYLLFFPSLLVSLLTLVFSLLQNHRPAWWSPPGVVFIEEPQCRCSVQRCMGPLSMH